MGNIISLVAVGNVSTYELVHSQLTATDHKVARTCICKSASTYFEGKVGLTAVTADGLCAVSSTVSPLQRSPVSCEKRTGGSQGKREGKERRKVGIGGE